MKQEPLFTKKIKKKPTKRERKERIHRIIMADVELFKKVIENESKEV